MMTMLYSVSSNGGSTATRRRSSVALLALLALVASVLIWAVPRSTADAQSNNLAPIAIISGATFAPGSGATDPGEITLNSASIDPDGTTLAKYEWVVETAAWSWISLGDVAAPSFDAPSQALIDRFGSQVTFRLTVTDDGRLTDSTTFVYDFNNLGVPAVDVAATANFADPTDIPFYDDNGNGMHDEPGEVYTVDALIDGPGENGNAANEWDVMEGSRVVLNASGSTISSATGRASYEWTRVFPTGGTDGTDAEFVIDGIERPSGFATITPGFVYYRVTVTDSATDAVSTSVVKLVVHDVSNAPRVTVPFRDAMGVPVVTAAAGGTVHPADVANQGDPGRYVVSPGARVTLPAVGVDGDGEALAYTWTGATPSSRNPLMATSATFRAPTGVSDGTVVPVTVTVTDPGGLSATKSIDMVVVANTPPTAEILTGDDPARSSLFQGYNSVFSNPDGVDGTHPSVAAGGTRGMVRLDGVAFDADGDSLTIVWTELARRFTAGSNPVDGLNEDPLTYADPRGLTPAGTRGTSSKIALTGAGSQSASFVNPEVGPSDSHVPVAFTVIDRWGVHTTSLLLITIEANKDAPFANAGPDQVVSPGSFVRLNGAATSDADPYDTLTYVWTYAGIETYPRTENRAPITPAEMSFGYTAGQWFPTGTVWAQDRLSNNNGDPDDDRRPGSPYPYFTAPRLGDFQFVKLAFDLTVTDSTGGSATDRVVVNVVSRFFSGQVPSPDTCTALSLGGPQTYPFDSNGDGVADVCSLDTTRFAAVARQNALTTLANLVPVTDARSFRARVLAACNSLPVSYGLALGDSAADLAVDACSTRRVSGPPAPAGTLAGVYFSGSITGPEFCTNRSLGGAATYAYDSDGDGVAETCSLPYTRREAVARQSALSGFAMHDLYRTALASACAALGTTDFGDSPADLATYRCELAAEPNPGTALPGLANPPATATPDPNAANPGPPDPGTGTATNTPPVAVIDATYQDGGLFAAGDITIDTSGSSDVEDDDASLLPGVITLAPTAAGASVAADADNMASGHVVTLPDNATGTLAITLTVTDSDGATGSTTVSFDLANGCFSATGGNTVRETTPQLSAPDLVTDGLCANAVVDPPVVDPPPVATPTPDPTPAPPPAGDDDPVAMATVSYVPDPTNGDTVTIDMSDSSDAQDDDSSLAPGVVTVDTASGTWTVVAFGDLDTTATEVAIQRVTTSGSEHQWAVWLPLDTAVTEINANPFFTITLTVTDSDSNSHSIDILVDLVQTCVVAVGANGSDTGVMIDNDSAPCSPPVAPPA